MPTSNIDVAYDFAPQLLDRIGMLGHAGVKVIGTKNSVMPGTFRFEISGDMVPDCPLCTMHVSVEALDDDSSYRFSAKFVEVD